MLFSQTNEEYQIFYCIYFSQTMKGIFYCIYFSLIIKSIKCFIVFTSPKQWRVSNILLYLLLPNNKEHQMFYCIYFFFQTMKSIKYFIVFTSPKQ